MSIIVVAVIIVVTIIDFIVIIAIIIVDFKKRNEGKQTVNSANLLSFCDKMFNLINSMHVSARACDCAPANV